MTYTKEFFEQYNKYLLEPSVRKSHDLVLDYFGNNVPLSVVDCGCGANEYFNYGSYGKYIGIDQIKVEDKGNPDFFQADYRTLDYLPNSPDVFVSLFSIEAVMTQADAYTLYNRWFEKNKTLKSALVSGFYYTDKPNQTTVTETGGITSYQTLPDSFGVYKLKGIREDRIMTLTPSTMFGDNVVEVWKILTREKV